MLEPLHTDAYECIVRMLTRHMTFGLKTLIREATTLAILRWSTQRFPQTQTLKLWAARKRAPANGIGAPFQKSGPLTHETMTFRPC
jgi:hypothetical protein